MESLPTALIDAGIAVEAAERPVRQLPARGVFERAEACRTAKVEFERSYLRTPLNWRLRLWGPSVGGYGILNGTNSSRHATKETAELTAAIWIGTGVTPAHQTDSLRKQYAARNAEFG